jgi:DNA-binding MarR family transcriptional regulator
MDAVMFETKAAHLAVQRVGRRVLQRYGITPARFDLMNALGTKGMRQSDLWKYLGVVRSVVSEMIRSLEGLGWVKRVRAADSRTWLVTLTRRGREIFQRAFDGCVENGDVAVLMDYGLAQTHIECHSQNAREEYLFYAMNVSSAFRTMPWFYGGGSLYCCDPEEYYAWLLELPNVTSEWAPPPPC